MSYTCPSICRAKSAKHGRFCTSVLPFAARSRSSSTKDLRKVGGVISFPQNLRGFAASTRVLPHEPQHFRRCFVSWLTSHPNFRTLYMALRPFAQLCFLQDAINPFQKYKNSSFSHCNQLKYCIFVNNVHLSAMSPTKE